MFEAARMLWRKKWEFNALFWSSHPAQATTHESVESVEEEELEDDDMKDVSTTDATTDATTNATTEADAVPSGAKADDVQHWRSPIFSWTA